MAALEIVWSRTATESLHQMFTFYNVRNGDSTYSRKIYQQIMETLSLITSNPCMYRATSMPDVRVFHCDNFKLFYRVSETMIYVEAVCDARQNPKKNPFKQD